MNEEYIANAERRRKIADDMAWSSGYAAGRAAGLRLREAARDPRPDWDALARLVDAAIRREEITASRGAEIMGVRLQTWRDWVRDLPALATGDEP